MNQTGFTGELKAQKIPNDQRKPREPLFYRGTAARGAHGSGERGGLHITVASGRLDHVDRAVMLPTGISQLSSSFQYEFPQPLAARRTPSDPGEMPGGPDI